MSAAEALAPDGREAAEMRAITADDRNTDPAERVLRVLMSSAYRKGSRALSQIDGQQTVMLHALRRHTARSEPVELTLMAFPFKVPNPAKVGDRRLPDLAEQTALARLGAINDRIRDVYEPGLRLHLILDGRALAPIVGLDEQEVLDYEAYLCALMRETIVADFVVVHDFATLAEGALTAPAEKRRRDRAAHDWWQQVRGTSAWPDVFRRTLGMVNLRDVAIDEATRLMALAGTTGRLPPEHAELDARVNSAVIEYRAFDLLIHEHDLRSRQFPYAIHATTVDRPGRLAIWLIRRGRSHLPWHGVASLDANDNVRVGPLSELLAAGDYEAIHLAGESTPFAYRRKTASAIEFSPDVRREPRPARNQLSGARILSDPI